MANDRIYNPSERLLLFGRVHASARTRQQRDQNRPALTYIFDDSPAGEQAAPAVWFAYSEDRGGEHPRQHLKNFTGALQADAYAGCKGPLRTLYFKMLGPD